MKIENKFGGSLRVTLLTSCQSGCDFCHLEGHKQTHELRTLNPALSSWRETGRLSNLVTLEEMDKAIEIAKALGLNAINLTGGEPTLHPELTHIISKFSEQGFSVAMTTHAEIPPAKFNELISAGLEWVIVSLHAMKPESYLKMDLVAQQMQDKYSVDTALKYSDKKLKYKMLNIINSVKYVKDGKLKGIFTNTVVLSDEQVQEVLVFCNKMGILPRIQRDLNEPQKSGLLIEKLIHDLEAKCVTEFKAVGDSSGSGADYEYLDKVTQKKCIFRLKDFGEVYIDGMCNGCSKKGTSACREKFYGVRLEHGKIRTCIDYEEEGVTIFSYEKFIEQINKNKTVPNEIANQYNLTFLGASK